MLSKHRSRRHENTRWLTAPQIDCGIDSHRKDRGRRRRAGKHAPRGQPRTPVPISLPPSPLQVPEQWKPALHGPWSPTALWLYRQARGSTEGVKMRKIPEMWQEVYTAVDWLVSHRIEALHLGPTRPISPLSMSSVHTFTEAHTYSCM